MTLGHLVRPTITKKIGVLLLLPLCGALAALAIFYSFLVQTAHDGHFINVAGRQRLLSEELLVFAHMVHEGQNEDRQDLRRVVTTFDDALRTMEQGGKVMESTLPPAPPEVLGEITAVKRLWGEIRPQLIMIADMPVYDPQAQQAYGFVQSNIHLLTSASDRVVTAFEARRQALRQRMLDTLAAIAVFDLALFLAGFWGTKRFIARPILSVAEAARRIREGDFSHRVPTVTRDEVATLASAFNEMSESRARTEAKLLQVAESLKEKEERLVFMADHDPLTGLFNRRRFQESLEAQLVRAGRDATPGAVIFLDLDGFKHVNDSFGHQVGDDLLKNVARLLREQLRDIDTLARLGGDEFAILLPQTDVGRAQMVAKRILQALRHHHMVIHGKPIGIRASMGIALFPGHGTTAERLLARADLAMYQAKENGRNAYCVYSTERDWQAQAESKLVWESRIREALEKDLFLLHCQPIMDLRSNQVCQYELLLRMAGSGGQVVLPEAFLGIAERFGLIHDIDRWVVRRAINLIADHSRAGRNLCLEVNLSGKAFSDSELLPLIRHELAVADINPAFLVLEITETAAIADMDQAQGFIEELQKLGCRFALDDFGVGFASFYHLKHLSVDYLKIDGTFVAHMSHDIVDQQMVKAMVALARGLGRQTIAECVEGEETLRLLREYGVDYAQGYHIGRPRPLSDTFLTDLGQTGMAG